MTEGTKTHLKRFGIIYIIASVILLWIATPFFLYYVIDRCFPTLGQIGDMFGTINSLFSGLTVAGLIYTIIRQQDEIKQSKIQFDEQKNQLQTNHDDQKNQTRRIFDEQKDQIQKNFDQEKDRLQKQIRIQRYQRFENVFYNHLKIHDSVLNGLPEGYGTITRQIASINNNLVKKNDIDELQTSYRSIHEPTIKDQLGQYLFNFQNVINTIYLGKSKTKNRHKYVKTFLCQLKQNELLLIFYHFNLKTNEPPNNFHDYKDFLYTFITTQNPEVMGILAMIAESRNIRIRYNELI